MNALLRVCAICIGLIGFHKSFAQNYYVPSTGSESYTTCSGILYDFAGPGAPYPANADGMIVLTRATPGTTLKLTFTSFLLDGCCDKLTIYDGPDTLAPVIGVYTTTSPGVVYASDLAGGGSLTLRLTTDGSNNLEGFTANIECSTRLPNDFDVVAASVTPTVIAVNDTAHVTCTIANLEIYHTYASSAALLGCFLSADTIIDVNDDRMIDPGIPPMLGNSSKLLTGTVQIRRNIPPGNYYVIFMADYLQTRFETNETNNQFNIPVVITASGADMMVQNPGLNFTTIPAGATITASSTVVNNGTTMGHARVGYVLSTDTIWDGADRLLGSSSTVFYQLGAGQSFSASAACTVPANTTPGNYFLLYVADESNWLTETDETNNVEYLPITVLSGSMRELFIEDAELSPSIVLPGSAVYPEYTVVNHGNISATTSYSVTGFFFSPDTLIDSSDVFLGINGGVSLAAGGSSSRTARVVLPANLTAGQYYLLFEVDYYHQATELSESNNVSCVPITVIAQPTNGPNVWIKQSISSGCNIYHVQFSDSIAQGLTAVDYYWNFGEGGITYSGQTYSNTFGPEPGVYTVAHIVEFSNGTSDTAYSAITVFERPDVRVNVTELGCLGNCDGAVSLTITKGVPPYNVLWSTGDTAMQLTALCAGSYSVTATDANGCVDFSAVNLLPSGPCDDADLCTTDSCDITGACVFTLNTCDDSNACTMDSCVIGNCSHVPFICNDGLHCTADSFDCGLGVCFFTPIVCDDGDLCTNDGCLNGVCRFTQKYCDDSLYCTNDGCVNGVCVYSPVMSVFVSTTPATPGNCDGIATLNVTGLPPPFTYQWNPAVSCPSNCVGLCDGVSYQLTVTSNLGCSVTTSVVPIAGPNISTTATAASCGNICDGTATVTIIGGCTNPPCSVQWYRRNGTILTGITTQTATNLCAGDYIAQVTDGNGGVSLDTVTVSAPPQSQVVLNNQDTLVCTDGTVLLSATPGFTQYTWNDGSTGSNLNAVYRGIKNDLRIVTAEDAFGCISRDSAMVRYNMECVWPGDANHDGIANNVDVITIGIAMNYPLQGSFAARPNATLNWIGQYSPSWVDTLPSGANYNHADCNGDGFINSTDTGAVALNYGLTHAKGPRCAAGAPLLIDLPDTLYSGETVSAPILLGDEDNGVEGLYGIAFSIQYNNSIIDENSIAFSYDDCWMGTPGVDLLEFAKKLNAKTDVAITRTDGTNLPLDFGQIGTISFAVRGDISGTQLLHMSIDNVTAVDVTETPVFVCGQPDSTAAVVIATGVNNPASAFVNVYPNPANDKIFIEANQHIEKVVLTDLLGKTVLSLQPNDKNMMLNVIELPKGAYLLRLEFEHSIQNKKVSIN